MCVEQGLSYVSKIHNTIETEKELEVKELKKLEEKEDHVREYLQDTLNPEEIEAAVIPLQ